MFLQCSTVKTCEHTWVYVRFTGMITFELTSLMLDSTSSAHFQKPQLPLEHLTKFLPTLTVPDLFVWTSAGRPHSHRTLWVVLSLADESTAVELWGSEPAINEGVYDDEATMGFGAVIEEVKVIEGDDNWAGREEAGMGRSISEIHPHPQTMSLSLVYNLLASVLTVIHARIRYLSGHSICRASTSSPFSLWRSGTSTSQPPPCTSTIGTSASFSNTTTSSPFIGPTARSSSVTSIPGPTGIIWTDIIISVTIQVLSHTLVSEWAYWRNIRLKKFTWTTVPQLSFTTLNISLYCCNDSLSMACFVTLRRQTWTILRSV